EHYLSESPVEMSLWAATFSATTTAFKWKFFGVWLAIWLVWWIAQCICETRDELRFTHLRRDLITELEAAQKNLTTTQQSQERLQVGYQQFLSVSKSIGVLLERPFGNIDQGRRESPIPMNTMPDSVIFAEAIPDSEAVAQLTRQFRRDLYKQG